MTEQEGNLAEKLEKLFDEVRKPDGTKYTQTEVVEGTNGVLTRVYLWKLRTGRATNPGFHIMKALADFFHVDTNYFSQSEESVEDKEKTRPTGRYFEEIQARAVKMDDKAQKAILDMMDFILSTQKNETPGELYRGTKSSGEENPE
jgi:DNA phosphorothioation-dependent restriction protein DptG